MIDLEYKGPMLGEENMAPELRKWETNRVTLLQALGASGTKVRERYVAESDIDIAPYDFVRGMFVEFIFPPQEDVAEYPDDDQSRDIDTTEGYELRLVDGTWNYDENLVRGHLRVYYDDAGNRVQMSINDVLGDSELPPEALVAIGAVTQAAAEEQAQ